MIHIDMLSLAEQITDIHDYSWLFLIDELEYIQLNHQEADLKQNPSIF